MEASLKSLVEELLTLLDVEVESVEVKTGHPGRAGRTLIVVSSKDSKRLIGPHGEHLRSLNTIAKQIAQKKYGEEATSFLIDVNGYHEAQMERVRQNARMLAQRARLFKHDVEMSPMSAYERLVIHELFAEDPEIETQSAGEGKFRHVVLKYKSGSLSV